MRANKFLKKMLQMKMQRIMIKYKGISDSFTTIKQNTPIKTAREFINNYLNRDKIYGDLLEAISRAEPEIENLKEQN